MAYITLYRKYRSRTFAEIVGQEHVVRTLSNAIKNNRLTHAYIFSGPRGTGKTSIARIMAKSLNCKKGKSVTPCDECSLCKSIADGSSMDVIEIDAASNRGIDEIRQLRERVNYAPVEGLYKIYIIDEVHMLTEPAFNALLKTLEEPPQNTLFILATTDPQKVPVTILSRCQRLDFGRIPAKQIVGRLKYIAGQEQIELEDKAAMLIARSADGGMRDAISLMDQIIAYSGAKITADDVILIMGSSSLEFMFELGKAVAENKTHELLLSLEQMINDGKNLQQIIRDMIDFFRSLLFVKMGSGDSLEMSSEQIERLGGVAAMFNLEKIKKTLQLLTKAELDMRWHPNARLLLEVAFIEMTAENDVVTVTQASQPAKAPEKVKVAVVQESKVTQTALVHETIKIHPKPVMPATPESKPAEVKVKAEKQEPVPVKAVEEPQVDQEISMLSVKHNWSDILQKVKMKNKKLYAFLLESEITSAENNKIMLEFKKEYAYHQQQVALPESKNIIVEVLKSIFGNKVQVEFRVDQNKTTAEPKSEKESGEINAVVSLFDGRIL